VGEIGTYSGEIIFATAAATIHDDIRHSFFVCPVVVVPAQFKPSKYDGLNDEICVPTTRATLFDQGEESSIIPPIKHGMYDKAQVYPVPRFVA